MAGVGGASSSPARQTPPPDGASCFPDGKCRTSNTGSGSNMLLELSKTLSSLMKPGPGFPLGASVWHSQQAGSRQGESGGPQRNLATEPLGTDRQQCSVRCTQCLPTRWDWGLCSLGCEDFLKRFELGWGTMSASHPAPQFLKSGR